MAKTLMAVPQKIMQPLPTWRTSLVAGLLRQGAVIAYPTEGLWGLGCLPSFPDSVARILQMKQRCWTQGLILIASSIEQVAFYLPSMDAKNHKLLAEKWPGATTFLVPDKGHAPYWITGRHNTLALRVSAHPIVKSICDHLGCPIVSTSANRSGKPAARTALQTRQFLTSIGHAVDYIVPGQIGDAQGATEIRNLLSGEVIRGAA